MAIYKNSAPFGSIVTNGLVLNLDATNRASYPGSGTTWNDTSFYRTNITLVNGPTFLQERGRGSIVFDGVDDYANGNQLYNYATSTWSCWFKPATLTLAAGVYGRRLMYKSDGAGANEINLRHGNGDINWSGYGASSYLWNISGSGITTSSWFNVTGVQEATNAYLYINSQLVASASYTGTITSTTPLYLGRVSFTPVAHYSGSISAAQLYNRALSAQEVQQNYNALKSRFGL